MCLPTNLTIISSCALVDAKIDLKDEKRNMQDKKMKKVSGLDYILQCIIHVFICSIICVDAFLKMIKKGKEKIHISDKLCKVRLLPCSLVVVSFNFLKRRIKIVLEVFCSNFVQK